MYIESAWQCNEYETLNNTDLYTLGSTGLTSIIGLEDGTWRFEDDSLHQDTPDMPDPYMPILGIPSRYYVSNP